jgi:hypothetical protein
LLGWLSHDFTMRRRMVWFREQTAHPIGALPIAARLLPAGWRELTLN